ncbi:hypothetical protein BFP76_10810 [Amylibacter kogurei]|uniref:Hedgehog/Intein (Hint) domain-containing protein n=1 Tax=Paramylibacter kogurei TaxID=1889778 RepID=A0A2G5KC44_9RHOB|nr:Hint domain-containing protein [Amylibacter kogurei]PIB26739.1 hypothetical protein BFP76_10810 [Amylibacter kogurei]
MAFITLTDADVANPAFWAGQDLNANSTLNATGVSDNFQITMTGSGITITDTDTGTVYSYSDADLGGGTFANIVEYRGNDADSDISGASGLNSSGYTGGSGNDTLTDDGNLGGALTGGGGDDTLTGGSGNNNISGGDGNDILSDDSGNNNLYGGAGEDILFGGNGSGNLEGGSGDDVMYAGDNTSFVLGGDGIDTLFVPEGSTINPFAPDGGNVTTPGGTTFTYIGVENVAIVCFAAQTRLRTPTGGRAVADLCVGDLVETKDHGARAIRWIGKRCVAGTGAFAPVVFRKGAIGNARELVVSQQHRILIDDWRAQLYCAESEVLIAAKHLVNDDTIRIQEREEITYYHIMFDQHEIVKSDGCWTESFYPGASAMDALGAAARDEIFELFPELRSNTDGFKAARPFITAAQKSVLGSDL